jgi:hypothetical protein
MKDPSKTELCKLVKKAYHLKETAHYVSLVGEGRYYCKDCGRVAMKKKNLCKAEKKA